MKEGLPKLERALRDRVLSEVQLSSTLWDEYCRRHPLHQFRRAFGVIFVALLTPIAAFSLFVAAPGLLNLACIGLGTFDPNSKDPAPMMHVHHEIGQALFLQAGLLTAIALACSLWKQLWKSRDLMIPTFLPMSDAEYHAKVFKPSLWITGMAIAWFTGFGYAYWAWFNGFDTGRWAAALALLIMQGVVGAALAVWLQGRFDEVTIASAFMVCIVSLFTSVVDSSGGAWEDRSWIGLSLVPAGWVSAAFKYGLVRRNPAGWLWLLPAAALVLLALRRAQLPYVIREFVFRDRREIDAIPEMRSAVLKGPQFPLFTARQQPEKPRLAVAEASRRIRDDGFLNADEDPRAGWLERWIRSRLHSRERAVLACMRIFRLRFWNWTWWWTWICLGTLALLALLAAPGVAGFLRQPDSPTAILYIPLYIASFLGPATLMGRTRNLPNNWLPVGDSEVARLYWRINLPAMASVAPLFAIVGIAVGWRVYDRPLAGLLVAATWFYLALALFPFRLIMAVGTEAADTGQINFVRRLPLLILLGCVGTVVVGAVIGALQSWDLRLKIASALALPLLSFGSWHVYLWSNRRWRGDWLPSK